MDISHDEPSFYFTQLTNLRKAKGGLLYSKIFISQDFVHISNKLSMLQRQSLSQAYWRTVNPRSQLITTCASHK